MDDWGAGSGHGKVDELLKRSGIDRTVRLTCRTASASATSCKGADRIASVPERRADRLLDPYALAKVPHPVKRPEIASNVFGHARHHRSLSNRWLRCTLFALFSDGWPA